MSKFKLESNFLILIIYIFTMTLSKMTISIQDFNLLKQELQKKISSPEQNSWMIEKISKDLSTFYNLRITQAMIENTIATSQESSCFVRYQIINNNIKVKFVSKILENPQSGTHIYYEVITNTLNELAKCIKIPNVDFIAYLSDLTDKPSYTSPVFTFCKSHYHKGIILIPDPLSIGYARGNILEKVKLGNEKYPWNLKEEKAFWRGAPTGYDYWRIDNYKQMPRFGLAKLSKELPAFIDAKFNQLLSFFSDQDVRMALSEAGYVDTSISIEEHMRYKYQILIDGLTASWPRSYWQLFSNSVIIKQDSGWDLWYYDNLKPFVHYIPYKHETKEDLIEQIKWAKNHDNEVSKIVQKANEFAAENLKYSDLLCYIYLALAEYAKLQDFDLSDNQ